MGLKEIHGRNEVPGGGAYHLGINKGEIGECSLVVLVGDPARVSLLKRFFNKVMLERAHREFVSVYGDIRGIPSIVMSCGIGPDNIEIAITELALLFGALSGKTIIRIGTCGILEKDLPSGSFIFSRYALGIDNLPYFYKNCESVFDRELTEIASKIPFPVRVYGVEASCNDIIEGLPDVNSGITITAPGFYAPQGRSIFFESAMPDITLLSSFSYRGYKIMNFEMECSTIYFLGRMLGARTATLCVGIFNRITGKGLNDYQDYIIRLASIVFNEYLRVLCGI